MMWLRVLALSYEVFPVRRHWFSKFFDFCQFSLVFASFLLSILLIATKAVVLLTNPKKIWEFFLIFLDVVVIFALIGSECLLAVLHRCPYKILIEKPFCVNSSDCYSGLVMLYFLFCFLALFFALPCFQNVLLTFSRWTSCFLRELNCTNSKISSVAKTKLIVR